MKKEKPKAMSLRQLKSCVDQAWKNAGKGAGQVAVEVWHGETPYRVVSVGQFGIVQDVTLTIKKESECET